MTGIFCQNMVQLKKNKEKKTKEGNRISINVPPNSKNKKGKTEKLP